jgi:hypothetical protein
MDYLSVQQFDTSEPTTMRIIHERLNTQGHIEAAAFVRWPDLNRESE